MVVVKAALAALEVIALCSASSAPPTSSSLAAVLATFDHDDHPDLRGVVVLREGRVVAERYYNGETANGPHDIRSPGKSITALLMGIAIDRGEIRSVDDTVAAYWPGSSGSAIGDVTLANVLTMRSGLAAFDEDPASPGNEDKLDAASDPLAFLRSVPPADPPGSRYRYNSLTAYTAGVVVAKATGRSLADFARTSLFRPLGIHRREWASDAAGFTKGRGNLSLMTRDFDDRRDGARGRPPHSRRASQHSGVTLMPRAMAISDISKSSRWDRVLRFLTRLTGILETASYKQPLHPNVGRTRSAPTTPLRRRGPWGATAAGLRGGQCRARHGRASDIRRYAPA